MTYEIHLATLQSQPVAVVRAHVGHDKIAEFLQEAFEEVVTTLREQGTQPSGPPFGRYVPGDDGFEVAAGFPVHQPVSAQGRVTPDQLPGGTVAWTVHAGPYEEVGAAYAASAEWLVDNGYVESGGAWESYLDGPDVPRPRTEVFVPCAPVTPHRVG